LVRLDAARWIRPQQLGDVAEITTGRLLALVARHPSLRAVVWFRLGSALHASGVRVLPSWVQRRLLRVYGLELVIGADIGGGLYIAHPVGCVLVGEKIGSNVTVISQVTFGTRDDGRWPVIGDGTFFGAGARVLGGITVGHSARVGANAVVLSDVAPGTTVVGIPAKPVRASV
jgi:serine O-acetyltransferase